MKSFLLALQFLTRLPIKISGDVQKKDLTRSALFFPFIGMLFGTFLYMIFYICSLFWSSTLAAILTILGEFLLTGGLHMDGLADLADGWYSGLDREKRLMVMKDSRLGAMGGIVLIFDILFKILLLSNIGSHFLAMLFYGMASKMIMIFCIILFPYARLKGTGSIFSDVTWKELIPGILMSILLFFINPWIGVSLIGAIVFILLMAIPISRGLGGLTGDTYGAFHEIFQVVFLLIVVAFH